MLITIDKPLNSPYEAIWSLLWSTRSFSETVIAPLSAEDMTVQTDFVVSPIKWHLGHTSWLFERFVLTPHLKGYKIFNQEFEAVFNSYYNSVGKPFNKALRGNLSRPTVAHIIEYRKYVDAALARLLEIEAAELPMDLIQLAIQHEKQHQELMLYDIKHILRSNIIQAAYRQPLKHDHTISESSLLQSISFEGGLQSIGHQGSGFAYDNESPIHSVFLQPFQLSNRCVSNAEFLTFVDSGGYSNPAPWLSAGWHAAQSEGWQHPLYWQFMDGIWQEYGFEGWAPLDLSAPVCHVSYFEADAYARWAGYRLPTEFEWESAIKGQDVIALNNPENGTWKPKVQSGKQKFAGVYDGVWEWTQSAYLPYPGYQFSNNGLGEYNGKFMSGQMVLRGGSCLSPAGHLRPTYRNFFEPASRWQMSGIRLAL